MIYAINFSLFLVVTSKRERRSLPAYKIEVDSM